MTPQQWIKRQIAALSLAFVNVEKNALGQESKTLGTDIKQERKVQAANLLQALKQGEVTQEVRDLRWRTYKVIQASQGLKSEKVGVDEDGNGIYATRRVDKTQALAGIKLDKSDPYPLEISYEVGVVTSSIADALELVSDTNSAMEYFAANKVESPIHLTREAPAKFAIEDYTRRLNVRKIDDKTKLLEFYISKYPDVNVRTTNLLIGEIKKLMANSRSSNIILFSDVRFVTYKTVGVDDFLSYHFAVKKFDKVVEFNGYYVLKFTAEVIEEGFNILETYKEEELEEKYNKKVKRKHNI